jgi:hypothetical protein
MEVPLILSSLFIRSSIKFNYLISDLFKIFIIKDGIGILFASSVFKVGRK